MNGLETLLIQRFNVIYINKKIPKNKFIKLNATIVNVHVNSIGQTDRTFHGTNKIIKQLTNKVILIALTT